MYPILRWIVPLTAALGTGCTTAPPYHELPIQRTYGIGTEPRLLADMIAMNSPYADRHIVLGVLDGPPGGWRWARQRAELRFQVTETEDRKFFADFVIAGSTFKYTGPVTMRFFVRGKLLGTMRCDSDGQRQFETPVPAELLQAGEVVPVSLEADKVWTAPDNTKLGFLLVAAGFKE